MNQIKVWDPLVRIVHWGLAILVFSNFVNEEGHQAHRWIGYAATALVLVRIVWGFVGTQHARFSDWFPTPRRVVEYTQLKLSGQAPRYIGHNPLGAVMMLALLALIINQGITGYMMGTDTFFGEKWLEEWHGFTANLMLVLVGLHILGAVFESRKQKENLPMSMIHGYKRAEAPEDKTQQ